VNSRLFAGLALFCCLAVTSGCGNSGSGASSGNSSTAGTAAPSEEQVAATIAELTQSVRKYAAEQRQAPETLDELVAKRYLDRIPTAPKGKRYAINKSLQVHLANE
jgi:hypothetical protein